MEWNWAHDMAMVYMFARYLFYLTGLVLFFFFFFAMYKN